MLNGSLAFSRFDEDASLTSLPNLISYTKGARPRNARVMHQLKRRDRNSNSLIVAVADGDADRFDASALRSLFRIAVELQSWLARMSKWEREKWAN